MKKRTAFLTLCLAACVLIGAAAAGGTAGDPLVSLSYLLGTFRETAQQQLDGHVDASPAVNGQDELARWQSAVAAAEAGIGMQHSPLAAEVRLKQGDALVGSTGLTVSLLAGEMQLKLSAGAVVDVTDGTELADGAMLVPLHRYLAAEDANVQFVVTSKTAVVTRAGTFGCARSTRPDYNAMADALKALGLFRGTNLGTGSGYELERAPARIEALIMLIRLLGEEEAALACTAEQPFSDVPDWCARYVAYAYEKGYSNGVGGGRFGTNEPASAVIYTEFILRALGYSSTAQTDISDAPERALAAGIVTDGECTALRTEAFLRADVVYLSWYALSAARSGADEVLHTALERSGVFSPESYAAAAALVTSSRMA